MPSVIKPLSIEEMKTTGKRLTPTQHFALLTLYEENVPKQQVADFFGLSYTAIQYHWRKFAESSGPPSTNSIIDILVAKKLIKE